MKLSSILTGVIVSSVSTPENWFAIPLRLIVGFGFDLESPSPDNFCILS